MNPAEDAIAEAHRAGFDVDLPDTNLELTPEERWRQHDAALELVLELEATRRRVVPDWAVIRWKRSGGRLVREVREGSNVVEIG